MIRFLTISLIFVLLSSSCSLRTTEGLRQVARVHDEIYIPYFADSSLDYIYKAKIEVYKKNFGGILIIKKVGPKSHRIVLTTEFGGKLLDLTYENNAFLVNSVVPDLDRKFILDVLKQDFKMLLEDQATILAVYESSTNRVYKVAEGKGYNFYFFARSSEKLEKIINTSKSEEKVEIDFDSRDGKIADNISITHHNIKLQIDLKKFKDEQNAD